VRRVQLLGALALVAGLTASCGVRADSSPRSLAADDVPYGLLDQSPRVATTTTVPAVGQVNVAVYFLVSDRVQPAPRAIADPPTAARAIASLLAGPTEEEAVGGLRTAINPTTQATVTRPAPDIVAIDLTPDFTVVPTPEQRLALAQLVFTATGIEGVRAVRFTIAGAPAGVPLPDGTVTSEPVDRNAFPALAPADPATQPA
jgi:spore germination protein GerM